MARSPRTSPAKTAADPVDLIVDVNRGRNPLLLARKFETMAADRFAFLRATAMLAHRSLDLSALAPAPLGWVCGDLHVQNFGCFRGSNRLVYFDLNDFDEAARLPVAVDLVRLLASILCAAPGFGLARAEARLAAGTSLAAYGSGLARGKAFWLERETAVGAIRRLLAQVSTRGRRALLERRTRVKGKRRRATIDGRRYLELPADDPVRAQIERVLASLAERFGDGGYFEPRDFAIRVAGMGSLGVPRYVAVVRGKGDPDRNALIDLKCAAPSSAAAAFPSIQQPHWPDEAERVVGVQDFCQAASPAYLCATQLGERPFVVRELQPVEDRVALDQLARQPRRLGDALGEMGRLAAYAQLRSAGRLGADATDALIDFGRRLLSAPRPWLDAARAVDSANAAAFRVFQRAWRAGDPRLVGLTEASDAPPLAAPKPRRARAARSAHRPAESANVVVKHVVAEAGEG